MPLLLAALLRPFIIWVVQIVVTTVIADGIALLLKALVDGVAEHYGISKEDSRIVVTNQIIDIAAVLGVGTGVLYSKIGIKAADVLGLSSRGLVKKTVSTGGIVLIGVKDVLPGAGEAAKKTILARIKSVSFTQWLMVLMLGQNIGDWYFFKTGLLQETLRSIFGNNDITLPKGSDAPPGFQKAEWDAFVSAVETQGVTGIESLKAKQSQVYSRDNLAALATWVYGNQLKDGSKTGLKLLQTEITKYLVISGKSTSINTGAGVGANAQTQSQAVASAGTSVPTVKVFTGVISQGVLGSGTPFTARPDDLIESAQDLQDAASNNLAAALAALSSSLSYEIKIQSSVITKEGFKQTGASQQIITGYSSTGQPKYKTVVNKFAVLNIYLMTEKGSRTKVRTVVLGPTNVLKFNPNGTQISGIESVVKTSIITSNPADISSVVRNVPVEDSGTETPVSAPQGSDPYGIGTKVRGGAANSDGSSVYEYTYEGNGKWSIADTINGKYPGAYKTTAELRSLGVSLAGSSTATASTPTASSAIPQTVSSTANVSTTPSASSVGSTATTLYEWYSARGQALPSVATRSEIYQGFGLGQAAFYTGTAEQNTKLLNALKAQG